MHIDLNQLFGVWQLISAEMKRVGEESIYPWGKTPVGYLFYAENGYMSATLMQMDRPLFATEDFFKGTQEELTQAALGYLSYTGTYTLSEKTIIHSVKASLFPNWIGEKQKRFIDELTKETLVLRTVPVRIAEKESIGYMRWRKIENTETGWKQIG